MTDQLSGKRVAVLATEGVEQAELLEPVKALKDAGAKVEIISPEGKRFQGYKGHEKGDMISVDCQLDGARPSDYEALVLPGGVLNPDTLRTIPRRRRVRAPLRAGEKADRRDLPRPLDAHQRRRRSRQADDVMAFPRNGSAQCGSRMGRRGGGDGRGSRDFTQAGGFAAVLQEDDRGVRRVAS